jgi:hypothetical protein
MPLTLNRIAHHRATSSLLLSSTSPASLLQGCLGNFPLAYLGDFQSFIAETSETVSLLVANLQVNDTTKIDLLGEYCGADLSFLPESLQSLADSMDHLKTSYVGMVDLTSCHRISPLIRRVTHGDLCTEAAFGLTWLWTCLFLLTIFAFVLLTTRAALFNTVIVRNRKRKPKPSQVKKEFDEYKNFMAEYYEDTDQWAMKPQRDLVVNVTTGGVVRKRIRRGMKSSHGDKPIVVVADPIPSKKLKREPTFDTEETTPTSNDSDNNSGFSLDQDDGIFYDISLGEGFCSHLDNHVVPDDDDEYVLNDADRVKNDDIDDDESDDSSSSDESEDDNDDDASALASVVSFTGTMFSDAKSLAKSTMKSAKRTLQTIRELPSMLGGSRALGASKIGVDDEEEADVVDFSIPESPYIQYPAHGHHLPSLLQQQRLHYGDTPEASSKDQASLDEEPEPFENEFRTPTYSHRLGSGTPNAPQKLLRFLGRSDANEEEMEPLTTSTPFDKATGGRDSIGGSSTLRPRQILMSPLLSPAAPSTKENRRSKFANATLLNDHSSSQSLKTVVSTKHIPARAAVQRDSKSSSQSSRNDMNATPSDELLTLATTQRTQTVVRERLKSVTSVQLDSKISSTSRVSQLQQQLENKIKATTKQEGPDAVNEDKKRTTTNETETEASQSEVQLTKAFQHYGHSSRAQISRELVQKPTESSNGKDEEVENSFARSNSGGAPRIDPFFARKPVRRFGLKQDILTIPILPELASAPPAKEENRKETAIDRVRVPRRYSTQPEPMIVSSQITGRRVHPWARQVPSSALPAQKGQAEQTTAEMKIVSKDAQSDSIPVKNSSFTEGRDESRTETLNSSSKGPTLTAPSLVTSRPFGPTNDTEVQKVAPSHSFFSVQRVNTEDSQVRATSNPYGRSSTTRPWQVPSRSSISAPPVHSHKIATNDGAKKIPRLAPSFPFPAPANSQFYGRSSTTRVWQAPSLSSATVQNTQMNMREANKTDKTKAPRPAPALPIPAQATAQRFGYMSQPRPGEVPARSEFVPRANEDDSKKPKNDTTKGHKVSDPVPDPLKKAIERYGLSTRGTRPRSLQNPGTLDV